MLFYNYVPVAKDIKHTCRESHLSERPSSPEMFTWGLLSILVKSTLSHGHLTDQPWEEVSLLHTEAIKSPRQSCATNNRN